MLLRMAVVPPAAAATAPAPAAKRLRISKKTSPFYTELLETLGAENDSARQTVYLVTVSRVLPGVASAGGYRDIEKLTRRELADAIRNAFDSPVASASGAGCPRTRDGPLVRQIPRVSPLSLLRTRVFVVPGGLSSL